MDSRENAYPQQQCHPHHPHAPSPSSSLAPFSASQPAVSGGLKRLRKEASALGNESFGRVPCVSSCSALSSRALSLPFVRLRGRPLRSATALALRTPSCTLRHCHRGRRKRNCDAETRQRKRCTLAEVRRKPRASSGRRFEYVSTERGGWNAKEKRRREKKERKKERKEERKRRKREREKEKRRRERTLRGFSALWPDSSDTAPVERQTAA